MVLFFFFLGRQSWTLAFVRHLNIWELEEMERFLLRFPFLSLFNFLIVF